jgi:hypothetical protein
MATKSYGDKPKRTAKSKNSKKKPTLKEIAEKGGWGLKKKSKKGK